MIRLDAQKPVHLCDGLTRRDFLHAGSLALLGLSLPQLLALKAEGAVRNDTDMNCVMLFLLDQTDSTFEEVGPGTVLMKLLAQIRKKRSAQR